jgi:endoglycosylceramidase
MNEPYVGTYDIATFMPDVWQPRQEELQGAIAAVAPDRIVFFESPPLFAVGVPADMRPPALPAAAFAPHYYHPLVHDGTEYVAEMRDNILQAFELMAAAAEGMGGVPVWLGEFGVAPTLTSTKTYMSDMVEALFARGWGWAVWSDDRIDGFGLRAGDLTFHDNLIRPLTHPYAARVPGPITGQTLDLAAGRATVEFTWDFDSPLVIWPGPADLETDIAVVAVDGEGEVTCRPSARGRHECTRPEVMVWRTPWRVTLTWEATR